MFDIFYIGENKKLQNQLPFSKKVDSLESINCNTKMYWVVEEHVEIVDYSVFEFRPPDHDFAYEHIWKRDASNYGGVRLLPRTKISGTKEIDRIVCKKIFDLLYTKTPENYFEEHPYATHVWCVDPEYKLSKSIDWAPANFEPDFIHSFHLRGQLEHKYPEEEGGIKLYPKNYQAGTPTKYHKWLDAAASYPILYVDSPDHYSQRDHLDDEYVWLVDKEHRINKETLDFVPNPFEAAMIHSFRMLYQLTDKYPMELGGISLVPKQWKNAELKIHRVCQIEDVSYDVFYVNEEEFTAETYTEFASISKTDWFWVVDKEFEFNGKLFFVPESHEREYIHIFKIPGMLNERYPKNIVQPWDNRCGGVRLVNKNFDIKKQKYQEDKVPVKFDIFLVDEPVEFAKLIDKSRTNMFWVIDKDYSLELALLSYIPHKHEQETLLNFSLAGQLHHKYPEHEGGIYLVPASYNDNTQIKYKNNLQIGTLQWEVFNSEEEGRALATKDWFWVIDTDVDLINDFNLKFIPQVWDNGKAHVWQKLNPITNRQYDYSGVMLCPKVPAEGKGRAKYMRWAGSIQKEYPVFYINSEDYQKPLTEIYREFANKAETRMFWVVDAHTILDPDFNFDYYPTQWDQHNVHVFLSSDGNHKNVRLCPTQMFRDETFENRHFDDNSFENLKLINTIASIRPKWPVVRLEDFSAEDFIEDLESYKDGFETGKPEPFIWTVDPGANIKEIKNSPVSLGFSPKVTEINKVHCWQKVNDLNGQVHGYGGLRLWPTNGDYSNLTSDDLKLNRIKNLQYVREPGSITQTFDIAFISYYEPMADEHFKALQEKVNAFKTISGEKINVFHIKDVEGIFNAHQKAANEASSNMFWVIDADAEIVDDFDFSYMPSSYDEEVVHVWNSKNPITGHEYGYGGVKLFNTQQVQEATSWGLDFTTGLSSRFKAIPEVSCVTRFNTDSYSTWRSAFRECVKLALKDDTESKERLNGWLNPIPDADFSDDGKRGAEEGKAFAIKNKDNPTELEKINNFEWLKEQYGRA